MTHILKQQTEAQGVKEFDNIKGVEALSAKELKETEGGGFGPWLWGLGRVNWLRLDPDYARDYGYGYA